MYQTDQQLTDRIIGCIIKVHQNLGPGFLENIYRRAMLIELWKHGLATEVEKEVKIYYENKDYINSILLWSGK